MTNPAPAPERHQLMANDELIVMLGAWANANDSIHADRVVIEDPRDPCGS